MPDIATKAYALLHNGFTIGWRDKRINTNYPGEYMVVEEYDDDQLPTADGSNGPWAVVGDNLDELIAQGFDFFCSLQG